MVYILGTISLIGGIYWCRAYIQKHIQGICKLINLPSNGGLYLYTLIFLPGIMIHEMAHFMTAAVLGVKPGKIHLFPRPATKHQEAVALGSVQVAKVDAFRSSLIGAAPFLTGSTIIYLIVNSQLLKFNSLNHLVESLTNRPIYEIILRLIYLYLLFCIGNTMFSSKEDTRSWPLLVILALTLIVLAYFTGSLNQALKLSLPWAASGAQAFFGVFLLVLILDGWFISLLYLLEKGLGRWLK